MSDKAPLPSTPASYFEEIYKKNPDPWNYDWKRNLLGALKCHFYEQRKYWRTLRAIPRKHYESALELGCGPGVFSKPLAKRCGKLLAIDYSEAALITGRENCRHLPHVQFVQARIPDQFPMGTYDLILLSEVAIFLSKEDFLTTIDKIVASLAPGGHFLMVHTRRSVNDPLPKEMAHDIFIKETANSLRHLRDGRTKNYRLDLFEKPASASATATRTSDS